MTVVPVILRELRSQARQPSTYWLRIAAAAAALAIFGVLVAMRDWSDNWAVAQATAKRGVNPFSGFGAVLFGHLNATIFVCNCLLAPFLTADCISREKRDGTLGLLFLTPLRPSGIVIGKAFVHGLRGFSMFAAVLPMLAVPLLIGGVSGRDCLMALVIDAIVLLLGLAAGFLASAFSRDWIRSLILAEFLNLVLVLLFMCCHFETVHARMVSLTGFDRGSSPLEYLLGLLCFHTNFAEAGRNFGFAVASPWTEIWVNMTMVGAEWFIIVSIFLATTALLFVLAIILAAHQIRRSWRQEPPPAAIGQLQRSLTRPRFAVTHLRRRLSRSLDRNPIGWLQQYSWSCRITKWGWFTVILFAECIMLNDLDDFMEIQIWLVLLLLAGMAFSASASFRRERECGALELLLVCPLSVAQIIGGRLRGIWMQFLPASALLGLCLFVSADIERHSAEAPMLWALLLPAFIALPIVGLYFSTARVNFLFAWLLTLFFAVVTPFLVLVPVVAVYQIDDIGAGLVFVQILLGLLFWHLLCDRLETRRFAHA